MTGWDWIGLLLICLAALTALSRAVRGPHGVLLVSIVPYMFVPFVIRPMIMIVINPLPSAYDPIANARMAAVGYSQITAQDLKLEVFGLVILMLATLAYHVFVQARRARYPRDARAIGSQLTKQDIGVLLLAGWALRLFSAIDPGGYVITAAQMATIAVGAVVFRMDRNAPARHNAAILAGLFASEMSWSLLSHSKAPLFALLLWILLREVLDHGLGRRMLIALVIAVAVAAGVYPVIQASKNLQTVGTRANYEQSYPSLLRPFLGEIGRFDLIVGTTDAVLAGPGSWISPVTAVKRTLLYVEPIPYIVQRPPETGLLWSQQVRPLSAPDSVGAVHLAEGPAAEGYVIGGYAGIAVEFVILALLFAWVSTSLQSRRRYWFLFAISATSQPYLYERGTMGAGEGLTKSLQAAAIAFLVVALGRAYINASAGVRLSPRRQWALGRLALRRPARRSAVEQAVAPQTADV